MRNQSDLSKPMHQKTLVSLTILTLSLGLNAFAQGTNAPAGTNAMAGMAMTNAPAMDTTPKPDAAGTATGASVDAQDASGTHFVTTAPADLSDDDKKDPAKVKKYLDGRQAF